MRSSLKPEATASRSRQPSFRGQPVVLGGIVEEFRARLYAPRPLPRPPDLREARRDEPRPATARIFEEERQGGEEDQGDQEAVPAVLGGPVRPRAPPTPRAARVRRLQRELDEADPGELPSSLPLDVLKARDRVDAIVADAAVTDRPLAFRPRIVVPHRHEAGALREAEPDRKSTRLNSSQQII